MQALAHSPGLVALQALAGEGREAELKFIGEVDAQKLRGGFYTPDPVVDDCLRRVTTLLNGTRNVTLLEPAAGDGAFVRGLARLPTASRLRKAKITCVE